MTELCTARRHTTDPPCGKVHRPGSAIGERHARLVEWRTEQEARYVRTVGTPADWCVHNLGATYRRGGVTDLWPCEQCGIGCEGTRRDDGGGPERVVCCRGEECR